MSTGILGLNKDNLTVKFCDNNLVKLEFDTVKGKKIKYITFEQFADVVIGSKNTTNGDESNLVWETSDIYPNDSNVQVVQTKVQGAGKTVIILKRSESPFNIKYHETEFKNVGLPTLLFGIVVTSGKIRSVYVMAAKDKVITPKTVIYQYPFSNVNKYNGAICFGGNRMASYDIDTLYKTKNIPNMFLSMPNNDDGYSGTGGSNNSQMQQRQLLENLQGKEFNKSWLIKSKHNYESWFNSIN